MEKEREYFIQKQQGNTTTDNTLCISKHLAYVIHAYQKPGLDINL